MSQPEQVPLFCDGDLREYLRRRDAEAISAVERIPANELLNTPPEDSTARIAERYQCEPITLIEGEIVTDQREVMISTNEIPNGSLLYSGRSKIAGTQFSFHVPFSGEADLLRLRGSSFSSSMPRGYIGGGELVISFSTTTPDPEQLKARFDKTLGQIKQFARENGAAAAAFNQQLQQRIRGAVDARRERILKAQNTVAALGFPLRRRPDAPQTFAVAATRRVASPPAAPATAPGAYPAFKPEPTLDTGSYDEILRIIESMSMVLERSPHAFKQMGEEDLRFHFLVQLNGQFEGSATGETFNYTGKTDILIRVEDRNIFIAECKFWRGPQAFIETIDQLLGYLSWRDTKVAIVVFNRDTQMSTVVGKIPDLLKQHSNYKRWLQSDGESKFRVVMHQNGDLNREVVLTVLVFDVPK